MNNKLKEEQEINHARMIRREQLHFIREAIKKLVEEQKEVKAILRKPHTDGIKTYQWALEENKTKITSLHDMHHQITDGKAHHGTKRRGYWSYKKIREELFKPEFIPTKELA